MFGYRTHLNRSPRFARWTYRIRFVVRGVNYCIYIAQKDEREGFRASLNKGLRFASLRFGRFVVSVNAR